MTSLGNYSNSQCCLNPSCSDAQFSFMYLFLKDESQVWTGWQVIITLSCHFWKHPASIGFLIFLKQTSLLSSRTHLSSAYSSCCWATDHICTCISLFIPKHYSTSKWQNGKCRISIHHGICNAYRIIFLFFFCLMLLLLLTCPLDQAGNAQPFSVNLNRSSNASKRCRARTKSNLGSLRGKWYKPVGCFPSLILTWLVLGSFPPREPFFLTYISHPRLHFLIIPSSHPLQGQPGEQGSPGLQGMKGEQVSICQSNTLELHQYGK